MRSPIVKAIGAPLVAGVCFAPSSVAIVAIFHNSKILEHEADTEFQNAAIVFNLHSKYPTVPSASNPFGAGSEEARIQGCYNLFKALCICGQEAQCLVFPLTGMFSLMDTCNFCGYGKPQAIRALSLLVEAIGAPLVVGVCFVPGNVPIADHLSQFKDLGA